MPFKLNISEKEKAWKLESEADFLVGKKLGETIQGKEISEDLDGYELTITGATDFAGFPHKSDVEGTELRRVLLTKGWGMHKKPRKEGKKKVSTPNGLRLRKTVRGNQISEKTVQINLTVQKPGSKSLKEIFPDQNKPKEAPKTQSDNSKETPKPSASDSIKEEKPMDQEETKEEIKEEIAEEVAEEIKEDIPSSPETTSDEQKEEAAEKVGEEVAEETEEAAEEIAEEEEKKEEPKEAPQNDAQ